MAETGGAETRPVTRQQSHSPVTRQQSHSPVTRQQSRPPGESHARARHGTAAPVALCAAIGVLICGVADALSRATVATPSLLFWAGLCLIVVPTVARLINEHARRGERVALVVMLGLALYAVKVMRDPFGFTFADEFIHQYNVNEILHTHALFGANPLLPITTKYPGLEAVTAAVSGVTRLSSFGSGVIVIGAARIIMMLALFLLFETVSGSTRIAALGSAIYVANANFIYFDAQYSYESLALPLLVTVLVLVASREASDAEQRRVWAIPIILLTAAIVWTHHLSSYALTVALAALSAGYLFRSKRRGVRGPWPFAVFALVATTAWLVVVASATVGYLSPVFTNALKGTIKTLTLEAAPRSLFSATKTAAPAAPLEQLTSYASIGLLAAGLPFGLRGVVRRFGWRGVVRTMRTAPFAFLFCVAAVGFFVTLAMRLISASWETASRSQEFLFVGLAFVVALAGLQDLRIRRAPWLGRALTSVAMAPLVCGGLIAGWPAAFRLSQPYRVRVNAHVLAPESTALARWAATELPRAQRMAAADADARLLAVYGHQFAVSGYSRQANVTKILQTPGLKASEVAQLTQSSLRYVVADRDQRSFDNTAGYYFRVTSPASRLDTLLPEGIVTKWEDFGAARVFDSGSITVFDLGGIGGSAARP